MGIKRSTVYSLDVITFSFGGIDCTKGMGKDGFLTIAQQSDSWSYVQGSDGEGVFNKMPPGATLITAKFLQTSQTNALLSAYFLLSEQTEGGLPAPVFYEDRKGTSKLVAASAVIVKLPDENLNKEAEDVEWSFLVHAPTRFVGSH